jgi:integrase/recombinase XerD
MNSSKPNALGRVLRAFFADHLPRVRGSSPHTVLSYRDTLVLFLRFITDRRKRSVSQLDLSDLEPAEVLAFLEHLETTRHNLVATRNVRLAAIHAFFRYCATADPAWVEHCQRVLAIPFKRAGSRPIHYLEYEEIQAVLASVDRTTVDGRRDYVLLATMFNTGARVQEIVTLCIRDLQLEALPQVRLYGKGRKERWCPLWPQTAETLRAWLAKPGRDTSPDRPLFCNHRGDRLTRFGVRYLLRKYCARAKVTRPSLGQKRLHPHSMRRVLSARLHDLS